MNLALSVSSAILLILVFPRFNLTWLAPVALAPLIVACAREASWKRRFLDGYATGVVFWWGLCYWIQFVLQDHGGLGVPLSWVTFALFTLLKGLQIGAFAALAGFVLRLKWRVPIAIPALAALWVGLDRLHGPLISFTWLDLGNAGIDMPLVMRLAPWAGVYGLTLVFAMIGVAVALLALRRRPVELAWLTALVIVPLLPALPAPTQGTERVRVVQPNVDTEAEFTQQSLNVLAGQMEALSLSPGTPLIVWPEWPAPFELSPSFHRFVSGIATASHAFFLFNGVARTTNDEPLNSAYLVKPDGAIVDRYDQINLVPFGEYVPPPFGWVNRITKETSDFVPGNRIVVFPENGRRISVFICYESAFPALVRASARQGAEMLFNLSNDGYFAHTAAHEQHLELARMRAAENRRWVMRATNDGITAMIDPAGRITEQLPPYRQVAGNMHFSYVQQTTFYTRHGDWFAWTCLAAGLVLASIGALI